MWFDAINLSGSNAVGAADTGFFVGDLVVGTLFESAGVGNLTSEGGNCGSETVVVGVGIDPRTSEGGNCGSLLRLFCCPGSPSSGSNQWSAPNISLPVERVIELLFLMNKNKTFYREIE